MSKSKQNKDGVEGGKLLSPAEYQKAYQQVAKAKRDAERAAKQ